MCFYIFAPGRDIEIELITESVYLNYFGSSKIISDILINNISKDDISELIIIVPKQFLKKGPVINDKITTNPHGTYSNRTVDLLDKGSPHNRTYTLSGWDIQKVGDSTLNIIRPNTDALGSPFIYSGEILDVDDDDFSLHTELGITSVLLLHTSIHFSLFKYKFTQDPIDPGRKRWLRLQVNPKMAAIYRPSRIKKISLWLIDDLQFNY